MLMSNFTETTAENLKLLRGANGLNQQNIADILGLTGNTISKIELGLRALAQSEKKLLDLYFFGKLPEGVIRQAEDLGKTLDFTEAEWNLVRVLAQRAGQTPEAWIRSQILSYLAYAEKPPAALRIAAEDTPAFGNKPPVVGGKGNAATTPPPTPQSRKAAG